MSYFLRFEMLHKLPQRMLCFLVCVLHSLHEEVVLILDWTIHTENEVDNKREMVSYCLTWPPH